MDTINQILSQDFLQIEILGNVITTWIIAIVFFLIVWAVLFGLKKIIIAKLEKLMERKKIEIFSVIIKAVSAFGWLFYAVISLYFALDVLDARPIIQQWSFYLFLAVVVYYSVNAVSIVIDFGAEKIAANKEDEKGRIKFLSYAVKILIWLMAVIILISNFGYDVSALLAGLGIGGLAIAFASQQILGDIIAAFTIYFDKPFKIGDKIQIADLQGEVIKIGIRSTRLKGDKGEIVLPNKDAANARIINLK